MRLYMAVTPDRFEFPVFIEDNCKELERKTGIKKANIFRQISEGASGIKLGYKFVKVQIEVGED